MSRSRSWCLTINNYDESDLDQILDHMKGVEYGVVGREVGEENQTPHLQIYFRMKNPITFSALKKKFKKAHIEAAKANDFINREYCIKAGNYTEYGKMSNQGKRTDLEKIKNDIMNGKKVDDIVIDNPSIFHQYGRTLTKIEDLRMRKIFRSEMTIGEWVYGSTGTGKSEYAFKDFNPDTHYVWKYDNGWNDGYSQQEIVIVDEFRGQMPMNELLMMIDKHPNYYVRRRGREPLPFTSKKVIITSSLAPDEVYHNLSENDKLEQLFRRIKIIKLEKNII